jgi:hypothetical protein
LGRHPTAAFFLFAVSPIVSMIALFLLACVAMDMTFKQLGLCPERGFSTQPGALALRLTRYASTLITVVIPAIIASVVYCKLAMRLRIGRKWMFVSCAVLAIMAMLPRFCVWTELVNGYYKMWFALSLPGNGWDFHISVLQLVQLAVPLAIGWWFMRRQRDQGRLQFAS